MSELEHVRRPNLPWRSYDLTECGLDASGMPVISRTELAAKWKAQGQQRAAMTTCMTCLNTAQRWPSWDESPVECLGRETYAMRHGTASGLRAIGGRTVSAQFRTELLAIALLVEAHRDEFDQAVADLNGAPSLQSVRDRRQGRAAAGWGATS